MFVSLLPEVLDKAEFEEALEYDENSLSSASHLGLLVSFISIKYERFFLVHIHVIVDMDIFILDSNFQSNCCFFIHRTKMLHLGCLLSCSRPIFP